MNKLIHIGFGNMVNVSKIIAVVSPDSAPVKRMVQNAKEKGMAIDATSGRRTKAVLVMENSQIVLSALLPETIMGRAAEKAGPQNDGLTGQEDSRCDDKEPEEEKSGIRRGVLMVLSGFSGAGKGTVTNRLLEKYGNYALSVSMTTRKPRENEEEGVSYFFTTREQFQRAVAENMLIEYAEYCGNYYGTPREYVEKHLREGRNVILEIEVQGALNVKKQFPECLLLFVTPPSAEELKRRLEARGTESEEAIQNRLARAYEESKSMDAYDHIVINDDVEECVEEIHRLVRDARTTPDRCGRFIKKIRQELKQFAKGES